MKKAITFWLAVLFFLPLSMAQDMSVHMHRKVKPENRKEYLDREINYWAKFAESEIKKGNMNFWGVFELIGGNHLDKEPNFLIINNFNDIDAPVNWTAIKEMFPDTDIKKIMVDDISTLTSVVFIHQTGLHIRKKDAVPETDFRFVKINYHHVKNVDWHLNFEKEKVKPLFEKAMAENKTHLTGWGNGRIVAPLTDNFPYRAYSYDLFATLGDALGPMASDDFEIPEGMFDEWAKNSVSMDQRVYRIIKVVSAESIKNKE